MKLKLGSILLTLMILLGCESNSKFGLTPITHNLGGEEVTEPDRDFGGISETTGDTAGNTAGETADDTAGEISRHNTWFIGNIFYTL